jgi:acylphosphatase
MKILSTLALMLFFALGSVVANNSVSTGVSVVVTSPDAEVKKLVQYMIKAYNLNPDQQMKVKEAAMKMASDAAAKKPVKKAQRTKLQDSFSAAMSTTLTAAQLAQYKSALNGEIGKMLDTIIDAAAK